MRLIYASNVSLDGFTEDEHGALDWAPPDDDVFVFITELMRSAGTYLYGRRMYETMAAWETEPALAEASPVMAEYAELWRAADKVVYSTTLDAVTTGRTRLERTFDADAVARLKEEAPADLTVAGPTLAAALRLAAPMRARIAERGIDPLYRGIELPLTGVLGAMEEAGVSTIVGLALLAVAWRDRDEHTS